MQAMIRNGKIAGRPWFCFRTEPRMTRMARMMGLGASMRLGAYRCHPCHPWLFGNARKNVRALDQFCQGRLGEVFPPGFINISTNIPRRI
jgi:hypothetical protein